MTDGETIRLHAEDRQMVNAPGVSKNLSIAATVVLTLLLFWAYWPVLVSLFRGWQSDDNYSVCQLVPFVAIYLVWRDRRTLRELGASPCWWGLGLIFLAMAPHAYGLLFLFESAERYSLVLIIAGLVLLVLGWRVFRRIFWILLFLLLMVPLPWRVHNMISDPMRNMAPKGVVFILQVFGDTVSQGANVILLNDNIQLDTEAGSWLRMLMPLIVVTAVMAFLVKRPP